MVHEMKLQTKYYNFILNGSKRIELRLYDEKRSKIKLGDIIKFRKEENLTESFTARVVGLLRYETFADLVRDFDLALLATADGSMTKEKLESDLLKFYPLEKQKQYGVIGLRIEKLNE